LLWHFGKKAVKKLHSYKTLPYHKRNSQQQILGIFSVICKPELEPHHTENLWLSHAQKITSCIFQFFCPRTQRELNLALLDTLIFHHFLSLTKPASNHPTAETYFTHFLKLHLWCIL
jgi:hypothetical protein